MILPLVTYPNKLLRTKSSAVADFDSNLAETLDNMYETMINKNGVGLAAIQVGIPKRMLIINLPREDKILYKEDLLEIINPEIIESSGEILFQEGCLSVPNFYEFVRRFSFIKLKYCDRFGKEWILEAEDYLAVAIQHEIDHLNGVLFVDKLSILKRKKFEKEYKRLQKEGAKSANVGESRKNAGESSVDLNDSRADSKESNADSRESGKDSSDSCKDSSDSRKNKSHDSRKQDSRNTKRNRPKIKA